LCLLFSLVYHVKILSLLYNLRFTLVLFILPASMMVTEASRRENMREMVISLRL
jgi:hypothetical protein